MIAIADTWIKIPLLEIWIYIGNICNDTYCRNIGIHFNDVYQSFNSAKILVYARNINREIAKYCYYCTNMCNMKTAKSILGLYNLYFQHNILKQIHMVRKGF